MSGCVLPHEALGEVGHGGASTIAKRLPRHIAACLREGDDFCGPGPRSRRCDRTVGSDGDFDGASLVAVLDDIDLSPSRMDPDTEALDIVIPDDALFLGGSECVDGSFGDFRHASFPHPKYRALYRYLKEANRSVR